MDGEHVKLSRGNVSGYLFLYNANRKSLFLSEDFGEKWILKNKFSCPNLPIIGVTGGRQEGELYMLVIYLQMMGQRRHVYIYHSLDYGETFTIYHPVSIGPDPIYANFIAEDTLVEPGDTVQFTDLSNDAETWEWDFDNDGTINSYEQNPTCIYQDTGNYTVKLLITGEAVQDYAIRYDYISVFFNNSQEIDLNTGYQFISSNRSPENPDMLEVLGNNLNENLDFVRNSQGQMLQNIGGNWVNNIGDWISTEGYLFKMNNEDVLIMDGETINSQTTIELNIGYQFVSYLPSETLEALEAFSSILNDDLDFIRNSEGDVLRKIGPNWVNGIGDCEAGEGFLVKMNGEGVLVYP